MGVKLCSAGAISERVWKMSWLRCRPWAVPSRRTMICGGSSPSFARSTMGRPSASSVARQKEVGDRPTCALRWCCSGEARRGANTWIVRCSELNPPLAKVAASPFLRLYGATCLLFVPGRSLTRVRARRGLRFCRRCRRECGAWNGDRSHASCACSRAREFLALV